LAPGTFGFKWELSPQAEGGTAANAKPRCVAAGRVRSAMPAAMMAKVGSVFGTLRHPHLIQPYLAYYDHLASHYGGPWCSPIPWWCN
jgi:hypothetical protein